MVCPMIKRCKKKVDGGHFEKYCDGDWLKCPYIDDIEATPAEWFEGKYGDEPV